MKLLVFFLSLILLFGCSNNKSQENKTNNEIINAGESSSLIAYFSVTNNTKKVANYMHEYLQNDIFEIIPTETYTSADINYNNPDSRANNEQNDSNARPKIKNTIDDISKYDTIILGYPIWWGQAPKILYTFIESYDLTNKTIIPFCTSGSSPIGSSATNLAKIAPKAKWIEGKRFASSTSNDEIKNWLDNYIKKEKNMKLLINEKEMDVSWEENESVEALKKLLPLNIEMNKYGGFEQVGSLGTNLPSNDKRITTTSGDIVLYSSSQIVIFYESNTWEYTKLGHINMDKNDLTSLLNSNNVTLSLLLQ